ncbi:MAG: hypothetical protein DPW09_36620, partial [Anaerolineae bacterium]|nr:hypothetical protein [Anaerolineae bacterium]
RHTGDSDQVAASNHKARVNDPDIRLFTPKARVKEILLARYHARLPQGSSLVEEERLSTRVRDHLFRARLQASALPAVAD